MPALIRRVVDRALDAFCAATMAAIVLMTLFQVINRYAIQHPVSWTGEIARFLAVWVVLLGAARCVRDDSHIYIDLLYNLVGRRAQWWMMLAVNLLFATLAGVMIWQGVKILPIVAKQTAAASRISMAWVYLSVPLSSGFIVFYLLERFITLFGSARKPQNPEHQEYDIV